MVFLLILSFSGCREEEISTNVQDGTLIVNENVNEINLAATSFDTFNPIMTRSESVAEFLKTHAGFEVEKLQSPLAHDKKRYGLQFLPDTAYGAGFYVSKLTKRE